LLSRVGRKAATLGLASIFLAGRAQAWSSVREAYRDSIREVTAAVGAPGKPAVVRSVLSGAERQARMPFEVALRMRNLPEVQGRVANGEQISPAEMAARYFPLQADYDRVVQWLRDQGFAVTRTDANRLAVFASGSVDATATAFQVSFARVGYRGGEYTSAVTAPSVPAELSSAVLGIHGLQPHLRPHRMSRLRPMANSADGYVPSQILTAYGASSISQNGAGQSIAIMEQTDPLADDLSQFWADAGVKDTLANIEFLAVGLGPDSSSVSGYSDELTEASLDAEWASGLAPGAVIRVYGVGSVDPASFDEGYQQVYEDAINHPSLHICQLSLSFGLNEDEMDGDYFLIESQYMANLTAAGVTVFAASGDGGSNPDPNTGEYNASAPLQVGYPASDPSVTGVGGTVLTLGPSNLRNTEVGWAGSGGGLSTVYTRPSWQNAPNNLKYPMRQEPDVSADADQILGALVVQSGQEQVVGGTSWATPIWAAFCALINQSRGTPVGFLNPKLYALQGTQAFYDVTSGGNTAYPATVGYDMSTGLGAPNVAELIQLLGNAGGSLAILDQLGSQFVTPGQTATFAVATYPPADNVTYQWQRMAAGSSTWANLTDNATYDGSSTPFLAVSDVTDAMQGDQFQCIVRQGSATVTSSPAGISVGAVGVTTLAGWPEAGGSANGTGRAARFDFVGSLRLDSQGDIYVADGSNDEVRKVTPAGVVTSAAGVAGKAGTNDGPASSALFNSPGGVAVDPSGAIFVADSGNYTVREISASGNVTTLAGSAGNQGTNDGTGTAAQFYDMEDIADDGLGNLYVADGMADAVRKVVIATGAVTTFAGYPLQSGSNDGTGIGARFNDPNGVATDSSGNVYVSDTGNFTVRRITPGGVVTTIAGEVGVEGSQDGPASTAQFGAPAGSGLDGQGNLFVTDTANCTIREISAGGIVSTVAGQPDLSDNVDGPLLSAKFGFPVDLAVDSAGVIYVADGINDTVRRVVLASSVPTITTEPEGQSVAPGSTLVLTAAAGGNATSYQWSFTPTGSTTAQPVSDSASGATHDIVTGSSGSQLVITDISSLSAGTYTVVAMNSSGSSQPSTAATVTVVSTSSPGAVSSISARAYVGTGDNILIGGFYIVGSTSATVLIQAIGPALAGLGVSGTLQHPALSIHQTLNGKDVVLYSNSGWGSSSVLLQAAAAAYANPVLQPGSADSELLLTLPPGGYTAEVGSADGTSTGVALCAIYQLP
jgi:sugar lactone lactonase YvrE